MILITPAHMSLHDWADRTTGVLQKFGFRQRLIGDDWQKWGRNVISVLSTHQKGAQFPKPEAFATWQEWAIRLNQRLTS